MWVYSPPLELVSEPCEGVSTCSQSTPKTPLGAARQRQREELRVAAHACERIKLPLPRTRLEKEPASPTAADCSQADGLQPQPSNLIKRNPLNLYD